MAKHDKHSESTAETSKMVGDKETDGSSPRSNPLKVAKISGFVHLAILPLIVFVKQFTGYLRVKYCYDRGLADMEPMMIPGLLIGSSLIYITHSYDESQALDTLNAKGLTPTTFVGTVHDIGFVSWFFAIMYYLYQKYEYCWDCIKSYKMFYGLLFTKFIICLSILGYTMKNLGDRTLTNGFVYTLGKLAFQVRALLFKAWGSTKKSYKWAVSKIPNMCIWSKSSNSEEAVVVVNDNYSDED